MNEFESKVFDAIVGTLSGNSGVFDIEIDVDNARIDITGRYEYQYTRDTDYYSGTGEYTTTYACVDIDKCTVSEFTDEGEEVAPSSIEIDVDNIKSYVEDYMYNY